MPETPPQNQSSSIRRVGVAAFPDSEILDIAGPMSVFSAADALMRERFGPRASVYRVELISVDPSRVVTCTCGVSLNAQTDFRSGAGDFDTLLIAGGLGLASIRKHTEFLDWLRATASRARRLGSVCAAAVVLAEAGFLDGRRATTHWRWCAQIARHYPRVRFDPDPIFIRDGNIYTSAGVTAGIDLALALVEEDLGSELALLTARHLVVFLRRPGGQSQFSAVLSQQTDDVPRLGKLHGWILENLGKALTVEELADHVGMSPRNFARVFTRQMGIPPGKFVAKLRLEAARRRLEESTQSVERIAAECGFGSTESMRSAFQQTLRVSPQEYRKRFQTADVPSFVTEKGTFDDEPKIA